MRAMPSLRVLLLATGAAVLWGAAASHNGKVVEVRGEKVRIALEEGGVACIGHQVEIYTDDARLAGFWLVVEAGPGEVTAVKVEAVSTPRVGWKARVYNADALAQAPETPPPWEADRLAEAGRSEGGSPPLNYEEIFGPPPPGAIVSTRGYLLRLPDGTSQDGFDNFRSWAASRGPGREIMLQSYRKWKDNAGAEPFLGLWVEKNDKVMSQTYAMAPSGLIVTGVCPGAAAEKAGLRAGDIILKIDGRFVSDPLALSEAAGRLILEVERDSKILKITLEAEHHD